MEYEQKVRKKVWEIFGNSKKVTTFALAIEREIIDAKDGPFVYRLGLKIFILERGVRFPQGLPTKTRITLQHSSSWTYIHSTSYLLRGRFRKRIVSV